MYIKNEDCIICKYYNTNILFYPCSHCYENEKYEKIDKRLL